MPRKAGETDARYNTRRALRTRGDAKMYEKLGMGNSLEARASHGAANHFSHQASKAQKSARSAAKKKK